MKNLVWLASYPKSGNTWVRAFLTAYQADPGLLLDLNHLDASAHAADRSLFDRVAGFAASDLLPAEIDALRPAVYRSLAGEASEPVFFKVHECWRRTQEGEALFPAEATRLAVYIVRNPLAVAPSVAAHYGLTLDQAVEQLASEEFQIAKPGAKLPQQLPQPVGSWSTNVASWLEQHEVPVHRVRYEDLHAQPAEQFRALLAAAGLPVDEGRLRWALEQSRFDRLQAAEAAQGFRERLATSERFFRRGRPDSWRDELTAAQIRRVVEHHGDWMERLGYATQSTRAHEDDPP